MSQEIKSRRIEKLVSYKILNLLDFIHFDIYNNCIKGKQANKMRFEANWTLDVIELIHTYIYGIFPIFVWNGQ